MGVSSTLACTTSRQALTHYLGYLCKLSVGLTAFLCSFHGHSVVIHKGSVHTQLAGLWRGSGGEGETVMGRGVAPHLPEDRALVHCSGKTRGADSMRVAET